MKKIYVKLTMDVIMLLTVVLFYSKNLISMSFHEIGGVLLCGIFLVHIGLNHRWVECVARRFFDKTLPAKTRVQFIVDVMLLVCFALIAVSGIMISKVLFSGVSSGGIGWKMIHFFVSALTIVLLGIHIGLHADYIRNVVRKTVKLPQRISAFLMTAFIIATISFGSYSMATNSFSRWITMPFGVTANAEQRPGNIAKGQGAKEGRGQEQKGDKQDREIDFGRIVWHSVSYGSMILTFAFITAGAQKILKRKA